MHKHDNDDDVVYLNILFTCRNDSIIKRRKIVGNMCEMHDLSEAVKNQFLSFRLMMEEGKIDLS